MIAAPGRAPLMLRTREIMKAAVTVPTIALASPDQRMARTITVLLMVIQAIPGLYRPARVPSTSILKGTVVTRMGMECGGFRRNAVDYVLLSGSAAITINRRSTARADPCFHHSFWLFPSCIMQSWSHERCSFVMSADFHDSTLESSVICCGGISKRIYRTPLVFLSLLSPTIQMISTMELLARPCWAPAPTQDAEFDGLV